MTDEDVTVVPTRLQTDRASSQSVEATYHETQTQSRQRDAQRHPEPSGTESGGRSTDSTVTPHQVSRTTLGVIAFLLGAAVLLYGVAVGLDGVRHTLARTAFESVLDGASLAATVEVTRTAAAAVLAVGTLGVASVAGRAALTALGRS